MGEGEGKWEDAEGGLDDGPSVFEPHKEELDNEFESEVRIEEDVAVSEGHRPYSLDNVINPSIKHP